MFFCAHKHQRTDSCKAMYYKGLDAVKCLIIREHSSRPGDNAVHEGHQHKDVEEQQDGQGVPYPWR